MEKTPLFFHVIVTKKKICDEIFVFLRINRHLVDGCVIHTVWKCSIVTWLNRPTTDYLLPNRSYYNKCVPPARRYFLIL